MAQRVVVDSLPVAVHKGADEQQQGRLRLVEIGNQLVHNPELITGFNHYLRLRVQGLLSRGVHPIEQRLQRLVRRKRIGAFVGFELPHMRRLAAPHKI